MKNERKTEIKVGITVVVGILIFIWILGWAKNWSLSSNYKDVYVKFNNVSGLEVGDYVVVNGVKKGFVNDFKIEGEDVVVDLRINKDVKLKKDAKFFISMLDLMGGKKVEINKGTSPEPLDLSKVHSGKFLADIPTVMSMVGTVKDDLFETLMDIKVTLKSLNKYLTDSDLQKDIKTSLKNFRDISQRLNVILDNNRDNINKLAENSAELTGRAKEFISKNEENFTVMITEMRSVLKQTDSLLQKANKFTDETKEKKNNLGKLMYDKEVYNNLSQSVERLSKISKLLLDQLNSKGIKVDADVNLF